MGRPGDTCNHILRGGAGNRIKIKTRNGDNERIAVPIEICDDCIVWHRRNNLIIHNEEEERKWIKEGK